MFAVDCEETVPNTVVPKTPVRFTVTPLPSVTVTVPKAVVPTSPVTLTEIGILAKTLPKAVVPTTPVKVVLAALVTVTEPKEEVALSPVTLIELLVIKLTVPTTPVAETPTTAASPEELPTSAKGADENGYAENNIVYPLFFNSSISAFNSLIAANASALSFS
jgi:hypothetical protein